MIRAVAAVAATAVAAGCVAWTEPQLVQRRTPLTAPRVELRAADLPGTGTIVNDGTFRFQVDLARLCVRTELAREQVVTVQRKELTKVGWTSIAIGVASILSGIAYAATSDDQGGPGATGVFFGAALVGVPVYYRLRGDDRREQVSADRTVDGATVETACAEGTPAQILGDLVLETPWGARLQSPVGTDGAAGFVLDWAITGIDLRDPHLGKRLQYAWKVTSSRTGLAVDWTPGAADRDAALALIERAEANKPGEPPELAVVAFNVDGGALIAGETTTLRLTVENRGGGVARDLRALVRSGHAAIDGFGFEFGDLGPREAKTRTLDVTLHEDEDETSVTVVAIFSMAAHKPPADFSVQLPITPKLCPPEKLTRAQYRARRDKLRAMVDDGLLTPQELQRYDAILVACLK